MSRIVAVLNLPLLTIFESDITFAKLFAISFIVLVSRAFTSYIRYFVKTNLKNAHASSHSNTSVLIQISSYIIYIVSLLAIFSVLGLNINLLLAGSTAILVGLGLGFQQVFQNLVAGFTVLFDSSVRVGDILLYNGEHAKVLKLGLRTTFMETQQGNAIIVPNSKIVSDMIYNVTHNDKPSHFKVAVGVSYKSNPNRVSEILLACVQTQQQILKTPEPYIRFAGFGDSALLFEVFFATNHVMQVDDIKSHLRFEIFNQLKLEGIVMPYPQRVLHFEKEIPLPKDRLS